MTVLRVAEHAERTDTGRQRRANEDAYLARAPLFAIADGMGGAQAGEVASRAAVDVLAAGLPEAGASVEERLRAVVQEANERIHALSVADDARAGMGTTLTAVHVGEHELTLVHVGDSRCYRIRDGVLERLTSDHSLVEELVRQGRLSPQEAEEHPQRSIITRALGPEITVEPDSQTLPARAGDVYLLCSDGLTSMVPEIRIAELLTASPGLDAAARALIRAANDAGGRDNITVVLVRLEDVDGAEPGEPRAEDATVVGIPAVRVAPAAPPPAEAVLADVPRRAPSAPRATGRPRRRRRGPRPGIGLLLVLAVLGTILAGGYLASQAVYFVSVGDDGFVSIYRGLPVELPAGISLYQEVYVSGVSTAQLTPRQSDVVTGQDLRSRQAADDYVRQLELGQVSS